jgi:hypothetical protein
MFVPVNYSLITLPFDAKQSGKTASVSEPQVSKYTGHSTVQVVKKGPWTKHVARIRRIKNNYTIFTHKFLESGYVSERVMFLTDMVTHS